MSDIAALYRRLLDGLTASGKSTLGPVGDVRGGTAPPVHFLTMRRCDDPARWWDARQCPTGPLLGGVHARHLHRQHPGAGPDRDGAGQPPPLHGPRVGRRRQPRLRAPTVTPDVFRSVDQHATPRTSSSGVISAASRQVTRPLPAALPWCATSPNRGLARMYLPSTARPRYRGNQSEYQM